MKRLFSIIPDPEDLLSLEPEELAGIVLEILNSLDDSENNMCHRHNFSLVDTYKEYPNTHYDEIARHLMEAWAWLESEGMIAPRPGDNNGWMFVTRRGIAVGDTDGVRAYRSSNILPKRQLHPSIAQKSWSNFLRGEYDTAVFQAFKELEVSVRNACRYPPSDIGTPLMRKAFHPETGPLANKDMPFPERESLMHLFAGSIGIYKNPHSHRSIELGPEESAEMIILASHLMKIVDDFKT